MGRWTDSEIEILNKYSSQEELTDKLPQRTWRAIRKKRAEIGLGSESREVWTEEELQILSSCQTLEQAKDKLPHRSENSLVTKIKRNKISLAETGRTWKDHELKELSKFVDQRPTAEELEAAFPHRSLQGVRKKLAMLRKKREG